MSVFVLTLICPGVYSPRSRVGGHFSNTCSSVCTAPQVQVRFSRGSLDHLPVSILSIWLRNNYIFVWN